jgi:serine protease Do
MKGERIHRGYLGVQIQELSEDVAAGLKLPKDRGAIVARVEPGQPAARAGVQQGDVIVKVAGRDVTPDSTLSYIVAGLPVGSKVAIDVIRNGKPMTLNAVLAERPPEDKLSPDDQDDDNDGTTDGGSQSAPSSLRSSLGLSLQTLTPQIGQQLGLPSGTRGVVVTSVDDSSDAGAKGLQPRDVILAIAQRPVGNVAEAAAAVEAAKKAGYKTVLLLVQRGNRPATYLGVDLTGK